MSASKFHEAIVYVDESGDHGPVSKEYPVFVLAFCLFDKAYYAETVTTAIQRLKFRYFGHDALVLHEREIRKSTPPFHILQKEPVRDAFMDDVSKLIKETRFTLIAAVIRKDRFSGGDNVYHVAMKFGLERIAMHYNLSSADPVLHLICESRGKNEDDDLELAFRRICAGQNYSGRRLPCDVVFAKKDGGYAGMELADLIARPIGRHVIDPDRPNRAWDVLEPKFRRSPEGLTNGWGLKIYP